MAKKKSSPLSASAQWTLEQNILVAKDAIKNMTAMLARFEEEGPYADLGTVRRSRNMVLHLSEAENKLRKTLRG